MQEPWVQPNLDVLELYAGVGVARWQDDSPSISPDSQVTQIRPWPPQQADLAIFQPLWMQITMLHWTC